jgi:hypothetical protein
MTAAKFCVPCTTLPVGFGSRKSIGVTPERPLQTFLERPCDGLCLVVSGFVGLRPRLAVCLRELDLQPFDLLEEQQDRPPGGRLLLPVRPSETLSPAS